MRSEIIKVLGLQEQCSSTLVEEQLCKDPGNQVSALNITVLVFIAQ